MGKYTTEHRGSEACDCLEDVWGELQRSIRGLPDATIIPLDAGGRRSKDGHFSANCWSKRKGVQHEVAISPVLFTKPRDVLEVLIHEAAHAVLYEREPDNMKHRAGCSRNDHYYHRKEFKRMAEELGLECRFLNRRYGWARTGWPSNRVPREYRALVTMIRKRMPVGAERRAIPKRERRKARATRVTLQCQCVAPRTLRMKEEEWRAGNVVCSVCAQPFAAVAGNWVRKKA
jgi:hypothetical protein